MPRKYAISWHKQFNLSGNDSSPDLIIILCLSWFVILLCRMNFNLITKTKSEQRKLSNYLFVFILSWIYFSKDYISYFYSFYFSSNWSSLCDRNVERRRYVCKRSPVITYGWNGVVHWLWKLQTFQNHHKEYEHLTFCKGFSRTAPFSNTEGNKMANALKNLL